MTVTTLMLACVLTIALGAASMLSTLQQMDRDLKVLNQQLTIANEGTKVLNGYMDSIPTTKDNLGRIVGTVEHTSKEVATSRESLTKLGAQTDSLDESLGSIAASTKTMRASLDNTHAGTKELSGTISGLNGKIGPLVKTQHKMLGQTKTMRGGLCAMNGSLAYVLRVLNYLTAPPQGGPMTMRVELDKASLPPVPGVAAKAEPVRVFPRGTWPIYNEKGAAHAC